MFLNIRKANTQQDCEAIAQLTTQLGYPTSSQSVVQRLNQIDSAKNYHTLVIENETSVIAYTGFIELFSWEHDLTFIQVQVFVVDQAYRANSIGSTLMQAIEQFAYEKKIKTIKLNSGNRAEREAAHVFYQKIGFEKISSGFQKKLSL